MAPATLAKYESTLSAWLESELEPVPWLLSLSRAGLKASSVNDYRQRVSLYFKWLGEGDPFDRFPPLREPREVLTVLEPREVAQLISAATRVGDLGRLGAADPSRQAPAGMVSAMIAFQVTSGARGGETVRLRNEAVNLGERRAIVDGKGSKQREVRFGVSARRMMEMTNELLPAGRPYFFAAGDHPHNDRTYRRWLFEACWWAEIEPIYPHMLRHTWATLSIRAGMPVEDVRDALGHESILTTMTYVHREQRRSWSRYDSLHPLAGELEEEEEEED